ncbi:MAG: branched-chain amino acid transport system substrate-binding protein [Celeribacter sp.]|jgi:branched-chain amino acid transport system substrate-binding protein
MTRFTTAAIAALIAGQATTAFADEIKVGLLLPYSGVYAALGGEIEAGFTLGLETFGGQTDDTFVVVKEDTEVKPPVGLAKAKKLALQDKADVIVGVVSSGVLGAVRDFVDGVGVPLVVANAGNDAATGKDCSPFITRFSFSNSQVNRPMGQYLVDQGITKVFTMAPDYAAGHQQIGAFKAAFEAAGGEIVGQEFTPFQKTQDFGPYMANAKSSEAQAVYVFYAGGEAISYVKQYDSFGLKENLPLYGSGFLTSALYVNAEGAAAEGVKAASYYVPTIDNPENAAFVDAYKAANDRLPSEFAVAGYDAAHALVLASANGASDRAALAKALSTSSFDGPRGATSIDPATNNIVQPIYVYETVAAADGAGMTQKVLASLAPEQDPANGCTLGN